MPASKIQDEREGLRWFAEGRSYGWMVQEYRRKYEIETRESMWGNIRMRRGIPRRIARDDDLIPWGVEQRHRRAYPLYMLRLEARGRGRLTLTDLEWSRLAGWVSRLEDRAEVVHYDPATANGFSYVPRSPEDDDIIRRPPHKTRVRATLD
ncbi:hypothetical protein [Blastococcus sp. SYSU DS1021]